MVLPPPVHGVLLGAAGALQEPGELQVDLVLQGEHSGRLGATACGQELSPAKQRCVRCTLVLHCTETSVSTSKSALYTVYTV